MQKSALTCEAPEQRGMWRAESPALWPEAPCSRCTPQGLPLGSALGLRPKGGFSAQPRPCDEILRCYFHSHRQVSRKANFVLNSLRSSLV